MCLKENKRNGCNKKGINASEGTGLLQSTFTLFEATQWDPKDFRLFRIDHFPVAHNVLAEDMAFC
jgi:hypothetical protein